MWKIGSRYQTNQNCSNLSRSVDAPAFRRSLLVVTSLCFLFSTAPAATVNVGLVPEYPIQATSSVAVTDGTALFIVSYKTTQEAFFTALRGANSADALVSVFRNELQFFNSTPFLKGDYGTYENPDIGWSSGGGAIAEITPTTTSLLPIFALFSSSTNLVSTASFLLVRSRATSEISYIPMDNSNSDIEISGNKTFGSDVIFGQYFPLSETNGAFRMAPAGAYGQITSPLAETNSSANAFDYQITANNGANQFFATTNTNSANPLTSTNLPSWASVNTNTGVIQFTTNSVAGNYAIRLVASNSVTASVATNTLNLVLQATPLRFSTTTNRITATAGVAITPFTFVATPGTSSYSRDLGDLYGLVLSTNGTLSGIPTTEGSNVVQVRATSGDESTTTTFTLAVALPTISLPSGSLDDQGRIVAVAGTPRTIPLTVTPDDFTVDSYSFDPEISGVTYNEGNLKIESTAAPFEKGTTSKAVILLLKRTNGLSSEVSASLTFNLRVEAPAPTRLTTTGPFQVTVGESYGLQLATDVSTICPLQKIQIANAERDLPKGLVQINNTGRIEGTNNSTTMPWDFPVNVEADTSTVYEGGGTTNFPVRFELCNPAAPLIKSSLLTKLAGVGKAFSQYSIKASGAPFRFAATDLPPGLALVEANIDGTPTANIKGTPTTAGIKTVQLKAYNYFRPGDPSSDLQEGTASFQIYVSGAKPTKTVSVFGADNLRVGIAASLSAGEGYRVNGYGLPPGLIFNKATGLITGTPTVAGTFTATLFIQNALGWSSKTVTLRVQ